MSEILDSVTQTFENPESILQIKKAYCQAKLEQNFLIKRKSEIHDLYFLEREKILELETQLEAINLENSKIVGDSKKVIRLEKRSKDLQNQISDYIEQVHDFEQKFKLEEKRRIELEQEIKSYTNLEQSDARSTAEANTSTAKLAHEKQQLEEELSESKENVFKERQKIQMLEKTHKGYTEKLRKEKLAQADKFKKLQKDFDELRIKCGDYENTGKDLDKQMLDLNKTHEKAFDDIMVKNLSQNQGIDFLQAEAKKFQENKELLVENYEKEIRRLEANASDSTGFVEEKDKKIKLLENEIFTQIYQLSEVKSKKELELKNLTNTNMIEFENHKINFEANEEKYKKLSDQYKAMENYSKVQEELSKKYISEVVKNSELAAGVKQLKKEIEDLEENAAEQTQNLIDQQKQVNQTKEIVQKADIDRKVNEKNYKDLTELNSQLKAKLEKLESEAQGILQLSENNSQLRAKLETLESEVQGVKDLNSQCDDLKSQRDNLQANLVEAQTELKDMQNLKSQNQEQQSKNAEQESQINQAKIEFERLQIFYELNQGQKDKLEKANAEFTHNEQSQLNEWKAMEELSSQNAEQKSKLDKSENEIKHISNKYEILLTNNDRVEEELQDLKEEKNKFHNEKSIIKNLQSDLEQLNSQTESLKTYNEKLQSEYTDLQTTQSTQKVQLSTISEEAYQYKQLTNQQDKDLNNLKENQFLQDQSNQKISKLNEELSYINQTSNEKDLKNLELTSEIKQLEISYNSLLKKAELYDKDAQEKEFFIVNLKENIDKMKIDNEEFHKTIELKNLLEKEISKKDSTIGNIQRILFKQERDICLIGEVCDIYEKNCSPVRADTCDRGLVDRYEVEINEGRDLIDLEMKKNERLMQDLVIQNEANQNLKENVVKLESDLNSLKNEIRQINIEFSKVKSDNEQYFDANQELQRKLQIKLHEYSILEQSVSLAHEELRKDKDKQKLLTENKNSLEKIFIEKQQYYAKLEQKTTDQETVISLQRSEISTLKQAISTDESYKQKLDHENTQQTEWKERVEKDFIRIEKSCYEMAKDSQQHEKELINKNNQILQLKQNIVELETKNKDYRKKLANLSDVRDKYFIEMKNDKDVLQRISKYYFSITDDIKTVRHKVNIDDRNGNGVNNPNDFGKKNRDKVQEKDKGYDSKELIENITMMSTKPKSTNSKIVRREYESTGKKKLDIVEELVEKESMEYMTRVSGQSQQYECSAGKTGRFHEHDCFSYKNMLIPRKQIQEFGDISSSNKRSEIPPNWSNGKFGLNSDNSNVFPKFNLDKNP